MKVSRSILCSAIAVAYAVAHLPSLAPSLEDIDSINFALGLRDFDVAGHQPHPPGYPVYVALARASRAVVAVAAPALATVQADALALAFWSAIGGAVALAAAWRFFVALEPARPGHAGPEPAWRMAPIWAVALLAVSPLFWLSGLRPMSDMPGLALALAAQALLAAGFTSRRALVTGALVAGLAAGVRAQAAVLTVPLLAVALVRNRGAGGWWILSRPLAAAALGGLAWAAPLVAASGGVDGYLRALGTQAGEDFAWVDMLWANPTPRRLAFALHDTFVQPWGAAWMFTAVAVAAGVGTVVALAGNRHAVWLLAVAFGPYAAFHLLLQETVMVRYALPLLVPVCWLGVTGAAALARAPVARGVRFHADLWSPQHQAGVGPAAAAPLIVAAAVVAIPAGVLYGSEAHPAFRAIDDMAVAVRSEPPAAVYSHYSLRRPLQAAPPPGLAIVEPRRSYEWLGLAEYWRSGGERPVWFLADPRRTDLALIDPYSRRRAFTPYRWRVGDYPPLAGTRPTAVDWYRLQPPGWFVAEGWSLTPEVGGITRLDGTGPDRRPIHAFVRRQRGPMHLVVGGRHLGAEGAVLFELSIESVPLDTWVLDPDRDGLNFLRFLDLPDGLPGDGHSYARLTITARAVEGTPTPPVAIRQFDIQPRERLIYAFGEGWHEAEYDNATGIGWRWTSDRAVLRVAPDRRVRLSLRGESPLKYMDAPPHVRISAGGFDAVFAPAADFEWEAVIPGEAIAAGGGAIVIETDRVYLPGLAEGTADRRRLGLRLFDIDVAPAAE